MTRAVPVSPPEHVFASLRSPLDFRRVLRSGRRRTVSGVTVASLPRDHGRAAVGLVVGRSIGGAVERNRVKRRLRHAMREVGLPPAQDYVVLASAAVGEVEYRELVAWLRAALEENV